VFSSGRGLARWLSSDTRASTGRSGSGSRTVGRSNKIARMAWAMMVHGERFKEPSDRLVQIRSVGSGSSHTTAGWLSTCQRDQTKPAGERLNGFAAAALALRAAMHL
jgi:hypothetical protein